MAGTYACPICGKQNCAYGHELDSQDSKTYAVFRCARCGAFRYLSFLEGHVTDKINKELLNRGAVSHQIRKMQRGDAPVTLSAEQLKTLEGSEPPTPQEQIENLILWVGREQAGQPNNWAFCPIEYLAAMVGSGVASDPATEATFQWLLGELRDAKFFKWSPNVQGPRLGFMLTLAGWTEYARLRQRVVASRRAFMAMKFDDPVLDRVLNDCFKPAVTAAGFELKPVNEEQQAGLIDNQIRAGIRSARFVIADLTHGSQGAYFEAGFAEGLGLPVIYTCGEDVFKAKKTHFDTNHMVTVPWSVDRLEDAARQLTATIRATLPSEATPENASG